MLFRIYLRHEEHSYDISRKVGFELLSTTYINIFYHIILKYKYYQFGTIPNLLTATRKTFGG